jgi:hypothetical protein
LGGFGQIEADFLNPLQFAQIRPNAKRAKPIIDFTPNFMP